MMALGSNQMEKNQVVRAVLQQITVELPPILEDDLQALGQFIGSLQSTWPEIAVPEVLRQCLMSANVNNIDDVMDAIEKNKAVQDQLQAKQQTDQNKIAMAKAKSGVSNPPAAGGGQSEGSDGNGGGLEADRMARLTAAVEKLAEALR